MHVIVRFCIISMASFTLVFFFKVLSLSIMPTSRRLILVSVFDRSTYYWSTRLGYSRFQFHQNVNSFDWSFRRPSSNHILEMKKTVSTSRNTPTKGSIKSKQSKGIHQTSSAYKLVIVESPSKASTISSILNGYAQNHSLPYSFLVDSCKGHVRDLPESRKQLSNSPYVYTPSSVQGQALDKLPEQERNEYLSPVLGVRIANKSYDPIYIIMPQKIDIVRHLQKLASKQNGCVGVILATDEDREGEAIAYHLSQIISPPSSDLSNLPPMKRVTFNEITKSSIESAFFHDMNNEKNSMNTEPQPLNLEDILDMDLVQAQETRRILDRLAGYPMSLLLCKKIAPGLSAGRVQSVGLSLIVNRERERMTFKQSEYCDIQATLVVFGTNSSLSASYSSNITTFQATLIKINQTRIATGSDFDPKTGVLYQHVKSDINNQNSKQNQDYSDEKNLPVYHLSKDNIDDILTRVRNSSRWTVTSLERKEKYYSPPLPFTTSTLQQEANKRLGLSVSDTMRGAQMLYEAGLISYMRTDSTHLSDDAVQASKQVVIQKFGSAYLNQDVDRIHVKRKKKGNLGTKLAQEAHEAIRPSIQGDGSFIFPEDVAEHYNRESNGYAMSESLFKIYNLIYERTVAHYMKNQITELTTVLIDCTTLDGLFTSTFRTSGSVMIFDGYTKLTRPLTEIPSESVEDDRPHNQNVLSNLPSGLEKGKELQCREAIAKEHITKPPARYSEASFVKELETLGVGRPSTYASIIQTLKSRFYVASDNGGKSRPNGFSIRGSAISAARAAGGSGLEISRSGGGPLIPTLSAFAVCSLLEKYCPTYVDPKFTSTMEERLDRIADGENTQETRRTYLEEYYGGSEGLAAQVEKINHDLSGDEVRRVDLPTLKNDKVGIFIGPWGPYVKRLDNDFKSKQVAQLPIDMTTDISRITDESLEAILASKENNGQLLGRHPDDRRPVRLRIGRFGAYLQWGEPDEKNTTNHSLPKHFNRFLDSHEDTLDEYNEPHLSLEDAVAYINLPRVVSEMNGKQIIAGLGPYGPYLKYNNSYVGLKSGQGDILTIKADAAEEIIKDSFRSSSTKKNRDVVLGDKDGFPVTLKTGRFGSYINWKSINVRLPSISNVSSNSTLQLKEACELISTYVNKERSLTRGRSQKNRFNSYEHKSTDTKNDYLPPRPRRPMSAYLYFCADKRPEVSNSVKTLSEVSKVLSILWTQLGSIPNGREAYEVQAAQSKFRYDHEMIEWRRLCDPSFIEIKESLPVDYTTQTFIHEARAKEDVRRTVKRSPSAYMLFCQDNREKVSVTAGEKLRFGDVTKRLAKLWNECDEEIKDDYRVKAKKLSNKNSSS